MNFYSLSSDELGSLGLRQLIDQHIVCTLAISCGAEMLDIAKYRGKIVVIRPSHYEKGMYEITEFRNKKISLEEVLHSMGVADPSVGILSLANDEAQMPIPYMHDYIRKPAMKMKSMQIVVADTHHLHA